MKFSAFKRTAVGAYVMEVWRGVDQLANALLGGWARESISSRLGRTRPACLLCRWLSRVEKDHCAKAAAREADMVAVLRAREQAQ